MQRKRNDIFGCRNGGIHERENKCNSGCQTARIAQNAAPWSAAYVCDVWCYDFGANSGKQLLWGGVSGEIDSGYVILCRNRHIVFSFNGKTKSSGFFGKYAGMSGDDKLAYACGGIVIAGLLYLILALIIKLVGVKKVMRFLPPVVTGPIIICIGLNLAGSAIGNASMNWPLALVALVTIIIFNIWGKGMWKIIPILMGVVISYVVACIFTACGIHNVDGSTIVNLSSTMEADWIGIPGFRFCKFDLSAILVMAPIALATMMEHIGDISAISATVGENYIEDPGLHRTLIGDGIATSISALIGGPANTTYGENTGVLELSRVHDPRVIRLAAVYAIILSFIPKMASLIGSLPTAIIGGVSFILYGMISAIGVRNVVENKVDLTKSRNLIIAAVILVSGLGFSDGITFTIAGTAVTLTGLAIAALAGIILNAILPGKDYEFQMAVKETEE